MSIGPRILSGSASDINVLMPPAQDGVRANGSVLAVEVIRPQPEAVPEFDWGQCVADFDNDQVDHLAKWREYSPDFCRWLHSMSLVGLYDGNVAFPVFDRHEQVIACHYRAGDGTWFYHPAGNKTTALVLGNRDARLAWTFESQWDAFAVMDRLGWHTDDDLRKAAAVVITRGAANGKLIGGKCQPDRRVYAFVQNDRADAQGNSPALKWLETVTKNAGCPTSLVKIPGEYKDANEWTKAGASGADIRAAIASANEESATTKAESNGVVAVEDQTDKEMLVLPSDAVTISACAEDLFSRIAPTNTLYARNGVVVEAAVYKEAITLQRISPQAFRSRIENYASCVIWRSGGKLGNVLKPTTVTLDMAGALLESQAVQFLPPIRGLVNAPVLLNDEAGCRVVEAGYDKASGLLVTGGKAVPEVPLAEAIRALQELVSEFDFETGGDRSRALAMLITPALKFGRHLTKAVPMNVCEADASQSGKTYLVRCMTAIYNETPTIVAQRKGGVGSDDENFASALIAGRPFILFDNRRDGFDSTYLEAFVTAPGLFPARVPHQGTINVDPGFFMLSLTSNGILTTVDLANRSSIIRIRKKKEEHQFKKYPEGDLYDHIAANQGFYLGAIFAVVKAWLEAGQPRTQETRHSFREWVQTLDWIIQKVLNESPLMGDHEEARTRFSHAGLAFVRKVIIAVRTGGCINIPLTCSDIYDLAAEHGVDIPMLRPGDRSAGFRKIGTELGRLFKDEREDVVEVEGFNICRTIESTPRQDQNGYTPTKKYRFTPIAAGEGDQKDGSKPENN